MVDMADWQITATTVYCADVDDEVTLLIYGDGTSKCTWHQKHARPNKETAGIKKPKSQHPGRQPGCGGTGCQLISEYRNKWLGK
jgi:hypothetical protein